MQLPLLVAQAESAGLTVSAEHLLIMQEEAEDVMIIILLLVLVVLVEGVKVKVTEIMLQQKMEQRIPAAAVAAFAIPLVTEVMAVAE